MGILDELIEKKTLNIYIDCRIVQLHHSILNATKHPNEKQRQTNINRLLSRIRELKVLKSHLNKNTLKKQSIQLWRDNNKRLNGDKIEFKIKKIPKTLFG